MIEIRPARSEEDLVAALQLRRRVFVEEQGVPLEEELDDLDAGALHVVAVQDGTMVGTLRLVSEDDGMRLGRLAVVEAARRRGVARRLIAEAERLARERGATRIVLAAQTQALPLYEAAGYTAFGDRFLDAGLEHVSMERSLA